MATSNTQTTERPPIIAVLGHVDHGKSTLLDYIRKSNIVEGEAGGITQHVAAYEVEHSTESGDKKRITFIDTPGHAAFKSIRSRGASIADIAILVVSAEDGVKAQTLEALESIKASGIPMVVAINKTDRPNADVERTKTSLLENGIYLEGLGGEIPFVPVSAKTGAGIPELLDLLLLVAEIEELKGDPEKPAEGFVIEAHRDQKRGVAATLIITDGSLKSGQSILAGGGIAPVRVMEDHAGKTLKSAQFSSPVSIYGFDALPKVGAPFTTYENKKLAEKAMAENASVTESSEATAFDEGTFVLPVVIKADVTGSLEAIVSELSSIGDEHAALHIIQSGIGAVSETDVKSAVAGSGTTPVIFAFNVGIDANAVETARQNGIQIETFNIIYKLTEHIQDLLKDRAPKRVVETLRGKARVLKIFSARKNIQTIGGTVFEGHIEKGALVHILRKDELVGSSSVDTLQASRQDVDRVEKGDDFGAQLETSIELSSGDVLEWRTTDTV